MQQVSKLRLRTFHPDRNQRPVLPHLHLLFWLSLLPFVTGWMGENHFQTMPVDDYGVVLLMCAVAYSILARSLFAHHSENAALAEAIGKDRKGWISIVLYILGIGLSLLHPLLGFGIYICVAIMWLIPDSRIESRLKH